MLTSSLHQAPWGGLPPGGSARVALGDSFPRVPLLKVALSTQRDDREEGGAARRWFGWWGVR